MTSLFNNRLQDIAIFMYKIKHRVLPSTVVEIFNTDSTGYSLRNADFRSQRFDTVKHGKHSLRYFGPFLWAKLKCNLRSIFFIY